MRNRQLPVTLSSYTGTKLELVVLMEILSKNLPCHVRAESVVRLYERNEYRRSIK